MEGRPPSGSVPRVWDHRPFVIHVRLNTVDDISYFRIRISAEALEVPLYHPNATPVLVRCEWQKPLSPDGTIPASLAIPLFLEVQVPVWRRAEVGGQTQKIHRLTVRSTLITLHQSGNWPKDGNRLEYADQYGDVRSNIRLIGETNGGTGGLTLGSP